MHLHIADGAQGDDHHVKAVKPAPALDEMKAYGAGRGEQQQGQGKDLYQAEAMQVQGLLPCCGINSRSGRSWTVGRIAISHPGLCDISCFRSDFTILAARRCGDGHSQNRWPCRWQGTLPDESR